MVISRQCDVVVVGGGPAGSIVGALLAQKGYDVVLLEKTRHPRLTVRESIIPHFWRYCDAAGASGKIEAEGFVQKAGGTVVWNGIIRQMRFRDFGFTRPALHVERDRMDHLLLEHARSQGVRVCEEVPAVGVEMRDDGATVRYRRAGANEAGAVACRWVVDASGQGAVVAKQLGIRVIDEGFRFMSVWGYFLDSKYVAADGRAYEFDQLLAVPPTTFVSSVGGLGEWGWAWHIPLRASTSVGLVLPMDEMKKVKATERDYEAYFLRKCLEIPNLDRLLEGARYIDGSLRIIRDYSYRPTRLAGPGYFLVGDAAAFVDPIFSVGFVLAMYSAYMAAWAIDRSFRTPADATRNQEIFASQYRARLEVARALALPRYQGIGESTAMAQTAVQFESSLEQELMYVVSSVTTRNENFLEMARTTGGQRLTSDKYRVIDEIAF